MWVEKSQVHVVIFTIMHRIEGTIYTYKDARILDELNAGAKMFIAVTNAKVFLAQSDSLLYEVDFMSLNKNQIVSLIPQDELFGKDEFI